MVERASDTGAGGVSTTPTPTPTPAATPVRSQDATAATPPPSALLLLEPSQQPPSRIGGFRLLNELGAGGMGRVWRARQESVGRVMRYATRSYAAQRPEGERYQSG